MKFIRFFVFSFLLSLTIIPLSANGATVRDSISHSLTRARVQARINLLLKQITTLQTELMKLQTKEGLTLGTRLPATKAADNVGQVKKAESPPPNVEELNQRVRQAVVNILCLNRGGGPFSSISGSGVIIDPRGVILTNAHLAEQYLVKDYPRPNTFSCLIRTGSPAVAAYTAKLLYLPPSWIYANPRVIRERASFGTGKDDYALLLIDGTTGGPIPDAYPYISYSRVGDGSKVNLPILIVSYPAELIGSFFIQNDLREVSTVANISKGYYLPDSPVAFTDLLAAEGSIVSQGGSSGGAVVSAGTGNLIGIITTTTDGATTESRELRAVTIDHIDRSLERYLDRDLRNLLNGDLAFQAASYGSNEAEKLKNFLTGQ